MTSDRGPFTEGFRAPSVADGGVESTRTVLSAVAEFSLRSAPTASSASVTLLDGDAPSTFVSTGPLAEALDERQYAAGHGPCLDAVLTGDIIEITDARTETRWPGYTPAAVQQGTLSSLSLPIAHTGQVAAGLNVYAHAANAFSPQEREDLTALVELASTAIANLQLAKQSSTLVEQMQTAMQSRAVIDQARGILMALHGCDAEEAFAILRRTSQHSNRKIRDIALEIVDKASRGRAG
jgi:GAF domain-containing protein